MAMQKILIVDDNPGDLALFEEAFLIEVPRLLLITAKSPAEATIKLSHNPYLDTPYTLMMMDATWSNGIPSDLLRLIISNSSLRSMHVVVMSSEMSSTLKNGYHRLGVNHFVQKPLDWKEYHAFAHSISSTFFITGLHSPWGALALYDGAEESVS